MTEAADAATGSADSVAESVLAKLAANPAGPGEDKIEQPEAEAPEEVAEAEGETEASEEETETAEPEAPPKEPKPPTDDDREVEIDGGKVTLKELKRGFLRERDYTKKTQALAAKEREVGQAIETERKQSKDYLDQVDAFVQMVDPLKAYEKLDWLELARKDQADGTNNYTLLKAQYDQLRDGIGRLHAAKTEAAEKANRETTAKMNAWAKEQVEILAEKFPEVRDPKKAKAITSELDSYAEEVGFTEAELKSQWLFRDARMWSVFRDAAAYRKAEAARKSAEGKKTVVPPKIIKPKGGEAKPGSTSADTRAFKRNFRDARSDRERAAAIIARLHK